MARLWVSGRRPQDAADFSRSELTRALFIGVDFWDAQGQVSARFAGARLSDASFDDTVLRKVRVTRRHHPLAGTQFEVLHASPENVVVQLRDGSRLRLPRASR